MSHPLDRPVWNALTTRLSAHAVGDERAVRMDPGMGVFLAARDTAPESLAALTELSRAYPGSGLVERADGPLADALPVGAVVASRAACVQMVATGLTPARASDVTLEPLTEADAPEMLALATLTQPGPFRLATHRLGPFLGVRREGRLVAMAGRRLRVDGFTELSGVCTHPDHRGQGYAGILSRAVTAEILASGEAAFLHAYVAHEATVAFYRSLGFEVRARLIYTVLR